MFTNVAIIGSGSWATALVKIITESGVNVSWLVRSQEMADYIKTHGHNPRYLSFANLDTAFINPVINPEEAIKDAEMVIFATPSSYLKSTIEQIDKKILRDKIIAVSIKGFIPGTGYTPSRFLSRYLSKKEKDILVLGGPCHAEEVATQKNTYLTVSSSNDSLVDMVCKKLKCHYIHPIANNDPCGIEYASILKNIIAIASGIAKGLHYGDNFQAVLVSNAMREAGLFIETVEPAKRDLFQSAYFGDLLVTAYSEHSRNRTLGKLIGKGIDVNSAIQAMEMIAEGFHASKEFAPILKRSKIKMPVVTTVHRILHFHASPFHEFKLLENQFN